MSLLKISTTFYLFIVHVCAYTLQRCIPVREQLLGVGSLLPPGGVSGIKLVTSGLEASTLPYFADPHFLLLVDDVTAMRKLPNAHELPSLPNLQVLLFHLGHYVCLSRS